MIASQRVVFTALPNGPVPGQPGKYRLSVHIAPQLRANEDTTLATFLEWANWPATTAANAYTVTFGNGAPIPATIVSPPAQNSLWTALFKGGALVRSHSKPDVKNRRKRSYPARNIIAFIQKQYTETAVASPDQFPHIDDLTKPGAFGMLDIGTLNVGTSSPPSGSHEVEGVLGTQKAYTNGAPLAKVASDFYQLHRFHRSRFDLSPYNDPDHPKDIPAIVKPKLDFHQVISAAGQFPPLLRHLGLVVDLVIDLSSGLPPAPADVRVTPSWVPAPPSGALQKSDYITPRTRCLIDGAQFRARPRQTNPELVDGRLPFNDIERYTLLQVDQDGAGLKAVDFAGNLKRLRFGRSSATPDRYALPSLRSGGLSVARINRAVEFHNRVGRSDQAADELAKPTPGELVLDGEDVIRGHRIDIRDTREGKWFSLAARTGTYHFPGGIDVPFADEGWTAAAPTEDDSPDQDLYLQETLFRWGGWSLAVPRPGARLDTHHQNDPPVTNAPVATDPDFPVTVDAKATPGTLPRLRFGRTFEVRARAVDLAGNSDPLDPLTEDRRRTPPAEYLRFEPIQTPPVLPYGPRTEGESLERAVLRSNYNTPPSRDVVVARHIVPPKADQLLAEQHGMFDTPFPNSVVNAAAYSTISKYPNPTPPDPNAPVVQSEQGNFLTSSEGERDDEDHAKSRCFPVDLVTLPYLPDPMAEGASLIFVDHPELDANQLLKLPFSAEPAWPVHKPIRLVLSEGKAPPSYNAATHQLSVPLGKADVVHVRLSAHIPRQHVDKLGIWGWMKSGGGSGLLPQVIDGRHWMITPYRTLTLVHAVRQPLAVAGFRFLGQTALSATKKAGQTFVTFGGTVFFSRKSTSRVDVVASWNEWIDRGPGAPSPTDPTSTPPVEPTSRRAIPFSISADRPGTEISAPLGEDTDRQEFGDTRHRVVGYTTIATTKFAEYFVQTHEVTVAYAGGQMLVLLPTNGDGVVPGSVKLKNKVLADKNSGKVTGAATYVQGTHYTVDNGAGTVTLKAGAVGSAPPGQKLTISFLVPPIVRPGPGDETVEPVVLSIDNSALPAAPKVVYVVPTFGWNSAAGPVFGTFKSERRGRGLRVYLERPWWSSGEGELLGVIINASPEVENVPSAAREKILTRVGVDPLFESTDHDLPPLSLLSFPKGKVAGVGDDLKGLTVPGTQGKVFVSGHEVGFDRNRDLWYCDIVVDMGSYFPFVKLGLCRFQPHSVAGKHLSPAVVTDFCQLTPDRSVTVVPVNDPPPGRRRVTVTGQSYQQAGGSSVPPLLQVTVEVLDADINSDLGWSQIGKAVDLARQPDVDEKSVWSGIVTVPNAPKGKKRMVIEEFERHRTGEGPGAADRLVYSDTVEL